MSPTATPNQAATSPDDILVAGATSLGIQLAADVIAAFHAYLDELLRWSKRMNLTALETPAQIVREGFLDSLTCAPLLPTSDGRVIDIGTGAGFPAIPLALVKPSLEFTLVEPSKKKVTFLRHVVRQLKLELVRIRQERAENLLGESGTLGAFDVALARAVAPLPDVGRLVFPFLRPAGTFLAQVGEAENIDDAVRRLTTDKFEAIGERVVPPEFGSRGHRILILRRSSARQ